MSGNLLVATRKGLFTYTRSAGEWKTETSSFLGIPVTMALADPRDGKLYAALKHGHFGVKLHSSDDGGRNWRELASPAYPASEEKDAPSVDMIWSLEAGGKDQPGELWAGTIPGGLFRSTDGGRSWSLVESLWRMPEREKWFGGGYDQPGIHSICVDPRNPSRIAIAVSCGGVWLSEDRGGTWGARCKGMKAAYMPPERQEDPAVQDPHRMVQCPAAPDAYWVQHHNGVFSSADDLGSWNDVAPAHGGFGFAVAVSPEDPNTAWFAPAAKDECRIPEDGKFRVARTRDGGKSFDLLGKGLPAPPAYDLIYRHGMDIDARGKALAMGSTTGSLWLSEDEGDSWRSLSANLPPIAAVRFAAG